jgi:hypothetical protein
MIDLIVYFEIKDINIIEEIKTFIPAWQYSRNELNMIDPTEWGKIITEDSKLTIRFRVLQMQRCKQCNLNWIKTIVNTKNPICPVCLKSNNNLICEYGGTMRCIVDGKSVNMADHLKKLEKEKNGN